MEEKAKDLSIKSKKICPNKTRANFTYYLELSLEKLDFNKTMNESMKIFGLIQLLSYKAKPS